MDFSILRRHSGWLIAAAMILLGLHAGSAGAQNLLPTYPGYEQYQRTAGQGRGSVLEGSIAPRWADDGKSFDYNWDGKGHHYDLATNKITETSATAGGGGRGGFGGRGARGAGGGRGGRGAGRLGGRAGRAGDAASTTTAAAGRGRGGRGGGALERGRQATSAASPDGALRAFYRDANLYLSNADGSDEHPITTDGSDKDRIRYGTATWVYGEELEQRSAMWWSPDSTKVSFYRFDESKVRDYYLVDQQLPIHDRLNEEPYVKVGDPNPIVDLYIYDVKTHRKTTVDVRDGKPFSDSVVGHYVYGVDWTPDSKNLIFHRTNRKQDVMELTAADPATGKSRVIVHEEWPASFTNNSPLMRYLDDGKRFIWESERNGFQNYYLYDLSGELLATLTKGNYEVASIVRVDEKANMLYYMARDGDNYMKAQLHRVGLDGKGDVRLTDPKFNHSVSLSPDGKFFTDVYQTHDVPPATQLVNNKGKVLAQLAKSDMSRFNELGLKKVEMFTYTSANGHTTLHGMLHFPSNFDPNKKYPMLLTVYGGPHVLSPGPRETFSIPNALTEYGFLICECEARTYGMQGKKLFDEYYGHLGIAEMDDIADGVKSLLSRPYVDAKRVGVFGTSYGGTSAATLLVRFPDIFWAACSNSPVTDYRNYDSIYAERNGGLLPDHKADYDKAAVMTYVNRGLKNRLLLYFGTADNNVHPANSLQLIRALQTAGIHFEVQVGPDQGHGAVNQARMMEFFIENLVLHPQTEKPVAASN